MNYNDYSSLEKLINERCTIELADGCVHIVHASQKRPKLSNFKATNCVTNACVTS